MSETEMWTGKLTRVVEPVCETVEDLAKAVCESRGITAKDDWNPTWVSQMEDDLGREFIQHGGSIYHIERKRQDSEGDIFDSKMNLDGTIDFTVRYYNGGCWFGEAVEAALDNMKK